MRPIIDPGYRTWLRRPSPALVIASGKWRNESATTFCVHVRMDMERREEGSRLDRAWAWKTVRFSGRSRTRLSSVASVTNSGQKSNNVAIFTAS